MKGILKDKFEDFEMPVSNQAWANVSSQISGSSVATGASGAGIWSLKTLIVAVLSLSVAAVATWAVLREEGSTQQNQASIPANENVAPAVLEPISAPSIQPEEKEVQIPAPNASTGHSATPTEQGKEIIDTPAISPSIPPILDDDDSVIPTHSKEIVYREHIAQLPKISALFDARIDANGNGQFAAQHSKGIVHYDWNFGDGHSAQLASPQHRFERGGIYEVGLTVTNEMGESMSSVQEIEVAIKGDLEVVNIITPNNDGQNDVFDPTALQPEARLDYIVIMNSAGDKIFESDQQFVWDGKLSDGTDAPSGVYLYFIRGLDKNKGIIEKTSKLTVIR
jgi:hypothetical protein